MGSRDYKIFRPHQYYHLFNRGNNRSKIFLDDQDYRVFLNRIRIVLGLPDFSHGQSAIPLRLKPLPPGAFSIISYCLMPNHYHLLVRQNSDIPITTLLLKVCTSYARYFNQKHGNVGHLFQDRYKAKWIDSEAYMTRVSAYIHTNPSDPWNYPYSNLQTYINEGDDLLTHKKFLLDWFGNGTHYVNFVRQYLEHKNNLKKFAKDAFVGV